MRGFTFSVIFNNNLSLIRRDHQNAKYGKLVMSPWHDVGKVVMKTLEDRYGWRTLSGYKCYSTSVIFVKFSDNICT